LDLNAASVAGQRGGGSGHFVQFYEDDAVLLDSVAQFVEAGLGMGGAAVVIATEPHRDDLAVRLQEAAGSGRGAYIALDAAGTLSQFMVDGWPDATRFAEVVGGVIARAAARHQHVRAFGEMVALLWAEGKPEAAIRLEELWNDLATKLPFSLMCAYPIGAFRREAHRRPFLRICSAHSAVLPAESYSGLTNPDDRRRAITVLQQKASALDTEAAERRTAERALARQQEELADFLENAVEGLQRFGPDGRILWANQALLQLLGYAAAEYVGHHVAEFHVDREAFDELWRRLMRRETLYDYPATLRCKNGAVKHVLIHSNALWENGQFLHSRCFIRDVTEQKRLENELKGRLEQLAEADRRKDEFLAMLGHELRNPLSALRNAVIAAGLDDTRRAHALDIAKRQTDQLARLVDDLLDVARITQGLINLRKERVSVARLVERAIDSSRDMIADRGHSLSVTLTVPDLEVEGDSTRLEQVIGNLVTNAAKYTEPGGRIDVFADRQGAEAVVRVRDTGVGIPPEMLLRVFELFTQGERALDRAQGGLGIGLTVVRRLVELHGGTVAARSEGLGKGAEFEVRIPALPPARPEPADAPKNGEQPHAGRARVLLLEDNSDAAESMKILLELLGHHVRVFREGIGALEAARANPPDVMLVDIGLPVIDGYEVARRVRQEGQLRPVTLVALTGYGREEDRQKAMNAGFDYHLVKPVDVQALQGLVARLDTAESKGSQLH
jgi:PAS domain S-box-containing protein